MENAVEVQGLSKRFTVDEDRSVTLKERVIALGRHNRRELWALRDVDLAVRRGETVGLIGHNGSGKSTLLKCIAGILRPTEGRISTTGRLASLLELGAGFHPDLTGRENVHLNGAILGLSQAEIRSRFDEIVAFAELEEFIDQQVKHYSSGMYARLGFAVASTIDPDVLLVDETLAVGDAAFQRKSLARIQDLRKEGCSIIVVTHAPELVRKVCDRAAVLHHGELLTVDRPEEAISVFHDALGVPRDPAPTGVVSGRSLTGEVIIREVRIGPNDGRAEPDRPLLIEVDLDVIEAVDDLVVSMSIHDSDGTRVLGANTDMLGTPMGARQPGGPLWVSFRLGHMPLREGHYLVSLTATNLDGSCVYDVRLQKDSFFVRNPAPTRGLVDLRVTAQISPTASS